MLDPAADCVAAAIDDAKEGRFEAILDARERAVLAYADYGASLAAGSKQVNNLDLTVQTPTGAVLHANGGGAPDSRNNVEMIEFTADEQGIYRARIEARTVPMGGSQPYALVVRGPRTEAAAAAASEQP